MLAQTKHCKPETSPKERQLHFTSLHHRIKQNTLASTKRTDTVLLHYRLFDSRIQMTAIHIGIVCELYWNYIWVIFNETEQHSYSSYRLSDSRIQMTAMQCTLAWLDLELILFDANTASSCWSYQFYFRLELWIFGQFFNQLNCQQGHHGTWVESNADDWK